MGYVEVGCDHTVPGAALVGQQRRCNDLDGVGTTQGHVGWEQDVGGGTIAASRPSRANRTACAVEAA